MLDVAIASFNHLDDDEITALYEYLLVSTPP